MYKYSGRRKEAQMRPRKEYYAYQDGNCVGIFKQGDRLPENADYYEVVRTWAGPKTSIPVKSRETVLHEDDVVHVKYKSGEHEWSEEVGTVRLLLLAGIDIYSSAVKVSEVEWNKEDQWKPPKTAQPTFAPTEEELAEERRRKREETLAELKIRNNEYENMGSGSAFRF